MVTLVLTTLLSAGCVRSRYAMFSIPMRITGTVSDERNGNVPDHVVLTFNSESISNPYQPTVGTANAGMIDLEYLLGFCRKERMHRGKYESPNDEFKIVVTAEGYVPEVLEFSRDELGEERPHVLELGDVYLTPN